jgi:hypothetical protein
MSVLSEAINDVFGTGSQTTTSGTTPQVPPDVEAARQDLLTRARAFAAEPFPQYNQPRVAGFTPDQQAAFQATRNLAQQSSALGALTPELVQQGVSAARGLATTLPETNLSGYMSPYTQAVLDPAIRAIQERAAQERLRLGQQSARAGAFGGSRQAIAESELERGTQRNIGEETARQRAAAYNQALQQFRIDQERIPALYSTALGQLGTGLQQTAGRLGTEVNPLLATGGAQQGLDQRNLDVLREAFLEERDYPIRGIDVLRGALGLTPNTLGIGSQQQQTTPGANIAGTIIGGIAAAPSVIKGAQSIWDYASSLFAEGGLVGIEGNMTPRTGK